MLAHATAHAFPWYASGDNIWGAQLMSAEERQQHVQRVREMKSYEECSAYIQAHRAEIRARAQARNLTLPEPAGSPCEVMQRMGRFKADGSEPACPTSPDKR